MPGTARTFLYQRIAAIAYCSVFACCAGGFGDAQAEAHASETPDEYQFTLQGGAWFGRLGGSAKLGPSAAAQPLDLATQFNLDASHANPIGELAMRRNDVWELNFGFADFSRDRTGPFAGSGVFGDIVLSDGDIVRSSFDLTTVAGEFTYWAHQICRMGMMEDERYCRLDLRIGPSVCVRYVDVDQTLEFGSLREATGGEWAGLLVGGRLQMTFDLRDAVPLIKMFHIEGGAALGPALGGDGGLMAQVHAALGVQLAGNVSISGGYRLLELDVERDDYELQGGLQGLFAAVSVKF